jgi:hypothetical protein
MRPGRARQVTCRSPEQVKKAAKLSAPDVWVAKDDGSDVVRATAITSAGRDYNGNITVRLVGGDQAVVTLVLDPGHDHAHTPADFHRQLLKAITELSDTAEPALIRPAWAQDHGWQWLVERL